MFDRCQKWRKMLNRDIEGRLLSSQQTLLQEHLANCERCRKRFQADLALRSIALLTHPQPHPIEASGFDESVLARLRQPTPTSTGLFYQWLHTKTNSFYSQLFSGAVAATGITGLLMFSALQPRVVRNENNTNQTELSQSVTHNTPPVPLESLLRTRTPRAAMFWSTSPREDSPLTTPTKQQTPTKRSTPLPLKTKHRTF